jgi:hypothetical protein
MCGAGCAVCGAGAGAACWTEAGRGVGLAAGALFFVSLDHATSDNAAIANKTAK